MKKKSPKIARIMPLLECQVVPITDPDEIAELERRIAVAERAFAIGEKARLAALKRLTAAEANGKKPLPRKKK
jgi:hypothetical protein